MLRPLTLLSLAASLLQCTTAQKPEIPGIAFALTSEHGTAAIYYPNGTHATISQVDGSKAYISFMRRKINETAATWSPCDALPPWIQPYINSVCPREFDSAGVVFLLSALKSNIEEELGDTFCFADIVLPDMTSDYRLDIAKKALLSLGLTRTIRPMDSGRAALIANHVSNPGKVILAFDYSRASLKAQLFYDNDGDLIFIKQLYSLHLGGSSASNPEHTQNILKALEPLFKPPFGTLNSGIKLPERISTMVSYGNMAFDNEVLDLLKYLIGNEVVNKRLVFEPKWATAVGAAETSYKHLNDPQFKTPAVWGCHMRSRSWGEVGSKFYDEGMNLYKHYTGASEHDEL